MNPAGLPATLVCFAVEPEAAPFRRRRTATTEILVTGIGTANALQALRSALSQRTPGLVLTCGFAGGLAPDWPRGTVVFHTDPPPTDSHLGWMPELERRLREAGAVPGHFLCASRVATTASEKRQLRETSGADVVEMESGAIREFCRQQGIPSATVRVVSDAADEDLPVDFNALMTADCRLHPGRLAARLIGSPTSIVGLLRLQRHCRDAAQRLAGTLAYALQAQDAELL